MKGRGIIMKRYISLAIEKEIFDELLEWCTSQRINYVRKGLCVTGNKIIQYFNMEGDTSDYQKVKEAFPGIIETGAAKLGNLLDCDSETLQNFCGILKAQEEALKKEQFAEEWFMKFLAQINSFEGLKEIEKYNLTDGCRRILESRICVVSGITDPYINYLERNVNENK